MKKILTILTIILLESLPFTTTCQAQSGADLEWAPLGATWNYTLHVGLVGERRDANITVVNERMIQGKLCRGLLLENGMFPGAIYHDIIYTYEEEGKVYLHDRIEDDFELLYDFYAEPGDSWELSYGACTYGAITVDSVAFEQIEAYNLRKLYVTNDNDPSYQSVIIEKLGNIKEGVIGNRWFWEPTEAPDFNDENICLEYYTDTDAFEWFHCYQSPQLNYVESPAIICDEGAKFGADLEWAPLGATWNYNVSFFMTGGSGVTTFEVVETKEINGKLCKGLKNNPVGAAPLFSNTFYTYEENNKVYLYDHFQDDFELIFDFNAHIGDSITYSYGDCSLFTFTLDSISFIEVDGYHLKQLHFGKYNTIIEKIGSIKGGPIPGYWFGVFRDNSIGAENPDSCLYHNVDQNSIGGVRCYQSPQITYYSHSVYEGRCDSDEPIVSPLEPFDLEEILNGRELEPIDLNNAHWIYNNGNQGDYYEVYTRGDTIINNKEYHKLYMLFSNYGDSFEEQYYGAIRKKENENSYWLVPINEEEEKLFIDFEAPFNSVLNVFTNECGSRDIHYTGMDTTTLLTGEQRLRWKLDVYNDRGQHTVKCVLIEGVGYDIFDLCHDLFYPFRYRPSLCTYLENNERIYGNDLNYCQEITSPVYPGDTNLDGIANVLDLLPIGIYYERSGTTRDSILYPKLLEWRPQKSQDWQDTARQTYDLKHIDANGDGSINAVDKIAIRENYGKMHQWGSGKTSSSSATYPITFEIPDGYNPGDAVSASVILGTAEDPVEGIYGIAFSISYDTILVKPNTLMAVFDDSWMGMEGDDLLTLYYDDRANGSLDIAIVRTDAREVSGYGKIADVHFVMDDDVLGKTSSVYAFDFSNIKAINYQEELLEIIGKSSELTVSPKWDTTAPTNTMYVAPNPLQDRCNIYFENETIQQVEIYDSWGKLVFQKELEGNRTELHFKTNALPPGIYFIRCHTSEGVTSKKVMKTNL